jgi:hypothetical protein
MDWTGAGGPAAHFVPGMRQTRCRAAPLLYAARMREVAAAVMIVAAVAVFRLIGPLAGGQVSLFLSNLSPLAAVVVAGAIYLPRRVALVVPFGALFVSTVVVNWAQGWPVASPYTAVVAVCFGLVFALAWLVRGTRRIPVVLGMTVAGTLLFYLLSNTVSWVFEPSYPRSVGGWVQSLTIGLPLPGAPPSWWFLVKSLAGDLLFTALMIAVCHPRTAATAARGLPPMDRVSLPVP